MARITVEDCLHQVDNRFELVLIAARRARELTLGRDPLVPRENDKPTVLALSELAEGKLNYMLKDRKGWESVRSLPAREESSAVAATDTATTAE